MYEIAVTDGDRWTEISEDDVLKILSVHPAHKDDPQIAIDHLHVGGQVETTFAVIRFTATKPRLTRAQRAHQRRLELFAERAAYLTGLSDGDPARKMINHDIL